MYSNDSKPVRDLKLEAALNGQEPTVRNLIMAAIGVMKNRKVRKSFHLLILLFSHHFVLAVTLNPSNLIFN